MVQKISWIQKRWRGTQLTVSEVLVYLITNKWAHAKGASTSLIAS